MLRNGFISEIGTYEKIQLGETEKLFLHIISIQPTSIYKISVGLKGGRIVIGDSNLFTGIQRMAYKNVYKRIIRLQSLSLIQEIRGNFKRKAKIFRLSPRGLFEELLEPYPWLPDIIDQYRNYPIVETLVYQFFELETIANFNDTSLIYLKRYLTKSCEAILSTLNLHRYSTNIVKRSGVPQSERLLKEHDYLLPISMDETIKKEAKNFVFEIVNMSKDEDPYQADPNYSNAFPRQALLKDKRFTSLLKEIKNDFEKGCKNYL